MALPTLEQQRAFLKDDLRQQINFYLTDQNRGIDPPPIQRPPRPGQTILPLPDIDLEKFHGTDLLDAMANRESLRRYLATPLTQHELGLLLWATQGVREELSEGHALRTVPSAGCRHAFESYVLVSAVDGLDNGIYRYLPQQHALVCERSVHDFREELSAATFHQVFISRAPVVFAWTVIPYRMEWRYDLAAHRVIAYDIGHVCQNLYLACEAISAGTCAIAAYDQGLMDSLIGVDGENEFVLYLAPVGKK
ncbi:SagB/ThcOx family dehydrogenase [uncultured Desulfuromonas sp.]|uniref:SagB/ThcOx family dehydrogenase n=1 Tax=uncultured Desulfuromonas sp. TaxID=181013 RepID=UPI002AAC15B5|nr:SagB/ThcOx family dehydrogenase [uncultured Desulfuromonas sp.]